ETLSGARLQQNGPEAVLHLQFERALRLEMQRHSLLAMAEVLFTTRADLQRFELAAASPELVRSLQHDGLLHGHGNQRITCDAVSFWQHSPPWLTRPGDCAYPQQYVTSNGTRHPLRPPQPHGVLYRRYIPWIGRTVSFELLDPDRDLPAWHRWMNDPRVAYFWTEQGDLEAHRAYVQKQLADPHTLPVIGRFDDVAFGYFEIYWAKEDRIAPFYDSQDYDRGLHLLVGEEAFRGRAYYTAWFSSICHFMFLDDVRTQRIVCEPRSDNTRQIANFDRCGFAKLKTFDFPHKNAMLVMLLRERFFAERRYLPDVSSRADTTRPNQDPMNEPRSLSA
ncbi:MAG TPA: GNAT family N-acetyltransferase, partial [Steroidobacter sp.]|nr:GNAT family N-acetyltransferase [Steroidobacter sp.]